MLLKMPSRVVRDWLSEFKALPPGEVNAYASTVRKDDELVDALYSMFENEVSHEELDPVCHQLFEFYRHGQVDLQRFTLEAIPVLIGAYLTAHSHNDKKRCSSIEACLLGVYNLEVIDPDGKPRTKSYTIPTLAVPSIYHEPPSLATLALTETALQKYHTEEHLKFTVGPLPQVDRINSQNRMTTLTRVLNAYNADIANLSSRSHYTLCRIASRLVKMGFDSQLTDGDSSSLNESNSSSGTRKGVQFHVEPHIAIDSELLLEMLNGIYFAMFNGQATEGIQAVDDIHQRAAYELFADVLLVTNAIKNSLLYNPSGQPKDGPMGISIALSPSQGSPTFSKSAITNASFRTKKLPEDIDVPEETSNTATKNPTGEENQPKYEDGMNVSTTTNSEKNQLSSKSGGTKIAKPLKSIMKKSSLAGDKPEKASKLHKKDAEAKTDKRNQGSALNDFDSFSSTNPKHSISMTASLGSSQNGTASEAIDPSMISVQMMRSSSSVTGRTFQVTDHSDLKPKVAISTSSGIAEDKRLSLNCDYLQDGSSSNKLDNSQLDGEDNLEDDTVDTSL